MWWGRVGAAWGAALLLWQDANTNRKRDTPPHAPAATEANKKKFIEQLALGRSPGAAAEAIKIARSTAYVWKKEDQDFDAQWVDAVETSLDKLETKLYDSALAGNSSDLQFALRHRRRDVYGNTDDKPQHSSFILNLTLQEQFKRLERLGLPLPVIESDYEEEDAPDNANRS